MYSNTLYPFGLATDEERFEFHNKKLGIDDEIVAQASNLLRRFRTIRQMYDDGSLHQQICLCSNNRFLENMESYIWEFMSVVNEPVRNCVTLTYLTHSVQEDGVRRLVAAESPPLHPGYLKTSKQDCSNLVNFFRDHYDSRHIHKSNLPEEMRAMRFDSIADNLCDPWLLEKRCSLPDVAFVTGLHVSILPLMEGKIFRSSFKCRPIPPRDEGFDDFDPRASPEN